MDDDRVSGEIKNTNMIHNEPGELTLIYHSDKQADKKARGYVESLQGFKIKTIDLAKESLTETQLAEIADSSRPTRRPQAQELK